MPSATIKIFLVNGEPKRLRTAELSNWTGKAVAGPRSELDGVLAREEAAKSGVYFLSGADSDSGKSAVYVGEAESIRERLRGHTRQGLLESRRVLREQGREPDQGSCSILGRSPHR